MVNIPQDPTEYRAWWHEQRPDIPYGFCWCGCGNKTRIAPGRITVRGHVKGQPVRYLQNHVTVKSQVDYLEEDRGFVSPCWIWQRARYATGYGYVSQGRTETGKKQLAHRFYYEMHNGPIPEGASLDHLCRTKLCVNPEHLEPVTHAENCRRGVRAILDADKAAQIRRRWNGGKGESREDLAKRFGVAVQTINSVVYGTAWRG